MNSPMFAQRTSGNSAKAPAEPYVARGAAHGLSLPFGNSRLWPSTELYYANFSSLIDAADREQSKWANERGQVRLSPRTVGKYIKRGPHRPRCGKDQRWPTFIRNHVHLIVACNFFAVTACFRLLYIFVALESGSSRLRRLHTNRYKHKLPIRKATMDGNLVANSLSPNTASEPLTSR